MVPLDGTHLPRGIACRESIGLAPRFTWLPARRPCSRAATADTRMHLWLMDPKAPIPLITATGGMENDPRCRRWDAVALTLNKRL